MDPRRCCRPGAAARLPRTRGDGPRDAHSNDHPWSASPHTRGWTPGRLRDPLDPPGFPAHAGMDPRTWATRRSAPRLPRTRGDGPSWSSWYSDLSSASPHTRGWTRAHAQSDQARVGFPAHAGMDLCRSPGLRPAARLPRTRGDGPLGLPARTGPQQASPHTRGWTARVGLRRPVDGGFPAHAGMDRARATTTTSNRWLPRTRGDGPIKCIRTFELQ